jgi:hypothetical protein
MQYWFLGWSKRESHGFQSFDLPPSLYHSYLGLVVSGRYLSQSGKTATSYFQSPAKLEKSGKMSALMISSAMTSLSKNAPVLRIRLARSSRSFSFLRRSNRSSLHWTQVQSGGWPRVGCSSSFGMVGVPWILLDTEDGIRRHQDYSSYSNMCLTCPPSLYHSLC